MNNSRKFIVVVLSGAGGIHTRAAFVDVREHEGGSAEYECEISYPPLPPVPPPPLASYWYWYNAYNHYLDQQNGGRPSTSNGTEGL